MAKKFKEYLDNGARWSPEAGGYINERGEKISSTPVWEDDDDDKNNKKSKSNKNKSNSNSNRDRRDDDDDFNWSNPNEVIRRAKEQWWKARLRNDRSAMEEAHRLAELARRRGGTIGANEITDIDRRYSWELYNRPDTSEKSRDYLRRNYLQGQRVLQEGKAQTDFPNLMSDYKLKPPVIFPQQPVENPYKIIPDLFPKMPQFQYRPPNYSITSDPSKTAFIPTANAKNRYMQMARDYYNAARDAYNTAMQQAMNRYKAGFSLTPIGSRLTGLPEGAADPRAQLMRKFLSGAELTAEEKAILGIPVERPREVSYEERAIEEALKAYLEGNATPQQKAILGIKENESGVYSAELPEGVEYNPQRTAQYIARVPDYDSREEAIEEFEIYKTKMMFEGVPPSVVKAEIDRLFPPSNKPSQGKPKTMSIIPSFNELLP